jgi:hypothetical protein
MWTDLLFKMTEVVIAYAWCVSAVVGLVILRDALRERRSGGEPPNNDSAEKI